MHGAFVCQISGSDSSERGGGTAQRHFRAAWYPFMFLQLYILAFFWNIVGLHESLLQTMGDHSWIAFLATCLTEPGNHPESFLLIISFLILVFSTLCSAKLHYNDAIRVHCANSSTLPMYDESRSMTTPFFIPMTTTSNEQHYSASGNGNSNYPSAPLHSIAIHRNNYTTTPC
jgi:hypothetical protein